MIMMNKEKRENVKVALKELGKALKYVPRIIRLSLPGAEITQEEMDMIVKSGAYEKAHNMTLEKRK